MNRLPGNYVLAGTFHLENRAPGSYKLDNLSFHEYHWQNGSWNATELISSFQFEVGDGFNFAFNESPRSGQVDLCRVSIRFADHESGQPKSPLSAASTQFLQANPKEFHSPELAVGPWHLQYPGIYEVSMELKVTTRTGVYTFTADPEMNVEGPTGPIVA